MRIQGIFSVFLLWTGLVGSSEGEPINVGVLSSAYPSWIEVIQKFGHSNASHSITTTVLNDTGWCDVDNINRGQEMIRRSSVVVIVGQYNKMFAAVTDNLRMPYFITSPVPVEQKVSSYHIRMIPEIDKYTLAIRDLFQHYNWKTVGVLYDTHHGSNIAALMMEHTKGRRDLYDIRAYNLQRNASADVVRWCLKDLRHRLVSNFLVICSPSTTNTVLTQALYLSLLSRPNSWLVVNLGSGDISLEEYIDSRANLTLIRLMVDPQSPECALNDTEISLTQAVYYDVFHIINGTNRTGNDRVSRSDMRKRLKTSGDINGCTGNLNFTKDGKRNETFLQMLALQGLISGAGFNAYWDTKTSKVDDFRPWLIRLNDVEFSKILPVLLKKVRGSENEGIVDTSVKIDDFTGIEAPNTSWVCTSGESGTWRSGQPDIRQRVRPSKTYSTMLREKDDIFGDRVLRITTKIEEPFVQWRNKTPDEKLYGNDRFEGFCVDILDEISKLLNFKYNLTLVPDGKFGSKKWYGWTGMINELIHDRADVALAPFSITPERSEVADFTEPFMTKGTSVVVRKPERSVWPFQFLSPFSRVIWIAIFLSFLFVGFFLFGVTRVVSDDPKQHYSIDLRESFWYAWGTLLRSDLNGSPTTTCGRLVSAAWWFFSLTIVSIYTANLAAFLTITNAHIPISSAADLAHQDEYDYGTVEGSQIESFFKHTKIDHYQKMATYMLVLSQDSQVRRVEDGFERVYKEKYAFIWDSPTVRHETANNCDFMEIGSPFDLKGYGIATQKGSIYSEPLSMAVLALHDNSVLYKLEGKWWRRPNCPDHRSNAKSKEIEIEVASGMFIVLCGGLVLSAIVCVVETVLRKKFNRCQPRLYTDPRDIDIQVNHNHVQNAVDDRIDESNALTRTLSLGENSAAHNRWESRNAC